MLGQFYLVALIGRFVGLHTVQSGERRDQSAKLLNLIVDSADQLVVEICVDLVIAGRKEFAVAVRKREIGARI